MNILDELLETFSISSFKTSFEDEGAHLTEANDVIRMSHVSKLPATVKIGGCEAKSDIQNCITYGVDNIVAPMVETSFSAKKFVDACKGLDLDTSQKNFFVNIETIQAVNNCEEIIKEVEDFAKGIVVGRSDLSKSLGLTKSDTNSEEVYKHTEKVLSIAKKKNMQTTMGGNLNSEGYEFVKKLYEKSLIDRIETRLVICNVDEKLMNNYQKFIELSIGLEKKILESRLSIVSARKKKIEDRINAISGRAGFLSHVNESEKSVIVIDFDNVIHDMTMGYHDGTIYGKPLEGAKDSLEKLSKKYKLIVYTCKANPKRPLVNGKTGIQLIEDWLTEHEMNNFIDHVTFSKPNAVCYIDDKAVEFTDWESCLNSLSKKGLV